MFSVVVAVAVGRSVATLLAKIQLETSFTCMKWEYETKRLSLNLTVNLNVALLCPHIRTVKFLMTIR